MFAVVEIDKKQYIVRQGDTLDVQKLKGSSKKITLNKVMLLADKGKTSLGTPYLKGARVEAVIEGQFKGKKIIVYKYKRRKKYRKKQGHRQNYTTIKIIDIVPDSSKIKKGKAKESAPKKAAPEETSSKQSKVKKPAAKKPAPKKSPVKKAASKPKTKK